MAEQGKRMCPTSARNRVPVDKMEDGGVKEVMQESHANNQAKWI